MNPDCAVTRLQTGGTLVFNEFYMNIIDGKMNGRARIEFDGGVLAPQTGTKKFLGDSPEWYTNIFCVVKEGGAVISNDVEIWTRHPFVSGAAQDGGLHKWGREKLAIITTDNTFNGPIEVHQGQVVWGNANNYLPTARLITHDGGYADINTYAQTLARVEGDGVVKQCNGLTVTGAVAPGFGAGRPGTLKFWHSCTFDDCTLEIDAGDRLLVNEYQNISGLALHINDEAAMDHSQVYTILGTVSGGDFAGEFKGDNIRDRGWRIHYDHARHEVRLKYHLGMMLMVR